MDTGLPLSVDEGDWPPREGRRVTEPNCGDGDRYYKPSDSARQIDLSNVVNIKSDMVSTLYYHALPDNEIRPAFDDWADEFSYTRSARQVLRRLLTWKQNGSGSVDAIFHEKLLKDTFNIDKQVRKKTELESTSAAGILEKESQFLQHLHELSRNYLERHYDDRFFIYRGCTYYLADIAKQLLEHPERSRFALETTVVVNFTISQQIAQKYHPLTLGIEIRPPDIAIAVDHLLWDHWIEKEHAKPTEGDQRYRDGEVQLFGDQSASFERQNIHFIDAEKPLPELIQAIPDEERLDIEDATGTTLDFTPEDHRAIAICIHKLAQEGIRLSEGEPRTRVHNWYKILSKNKPSTPFEIPADRDNEDFIEMAVEDLKEDVESVTGIGIAQPNEKLMEVINHG